MEASKNTAIMNKTVSLISLQGRLCHRSFITAQDRIHGLVNTRTIEHVDMYTAVSMYISMAEQTRKVYVLFHT